MSRIDEFREQIDACRLGSDDLHLPEHAGLAQAAEQDRALAAELDRCQQFDRAVISALHDVPMPAGLLERMLEKTAGQKSGAVPGAAHVVERAATEAPAADAAVSARPQRAAWSRRSWLLTGSTAVAAAIVALAVYLASPTPRTVSADQLAGELDGWMKLASSPTGWQPLAGAPNGFASDPDVLMRPRAWRSFRTSAGQSAVAYDLTQPQGAGIHLFVIAKGTATYGVKSGPFSVLPVTGGISVAAWQSKGLLYVLVVEKGGPDLKELIRQRREA